MERLKSDRLNAPNWVIQIRKWWRRSSEWDSLIARPPELEAPLRERMLWFEQVLAKIFSRGTGQSHIKYLLMLLDRNPKWADVFLQHVYRLFSETSFFDLLVGESQSGDFNFLSSFWDRVWRKLSLEAPFDQNFNQILRKQVNSEEDLEWLRDLDTALIERFKVLMQAHSQKHWLQLDQSFVLQGRAALKVLGNQASLLGVNLCRGQVQQINPAFIDDFLELSLRTAQIPKDLNSSFESQRLSLHAQLERIQRVTDEIGADLESSGVSVNRVHQFQLLLKTLRRMTEITQVLDASQISMLDLRRLIFGVCLESRRGTSVRLLLKETLQLLSRRISETNAEIGDHYIVRNSKEAWAQFSSGLGGGAIIAFTTLLKTWAALSLFGFFLGIFNGLNYSVSFLMIHFFGFALGTKQPAMTAQALSQQVDSALRTRDSVKLKVTVRQIAWSQSVSLLGNIFCVVPLVFLLQLLLSKGSGLTLAPETAQYIIKSLQPLSAAPVFAAFTGVLLWVASLSAGWAQNWFRFRSQRQAIRHQPFLNFVFGARGAESVALFFENHISALVGNTVLGFSLGLLPVFLEFFHLGLDVRHVTLSAGNLTLAAFAMGPTVVSELSFWSAVLGLIVIGFLNVAVAFSLAFMVALRSRQINAWDRRWLYTELIPGLRKKPV